MLCTLGLRDSERFVCQVPNDYRYYREVGVLWQFTPDVSAWR